MTSLERFEEIRNIIEIAENRAMAVDGPVNKTIDHMTDSDIKRIWRLASGGVKNEKRKRS